jgi:hypothetical protein
MIRKTVEGREYESQMVGELHFDKEPVEGSFNPVTSDGVFKALGGCSSVEEKLKVIAAALNDLNTRLAALEIVAADSNIGSVIADSINTQVLKVGGSDLEARVAAIEAILTNNNLRTAAAPDSLTKSVSVDNLDLQAEAKTEVNTKEIENKIMEGK